MEERLNKTDTDPDCTARKDQSKLRLPLFPFILFGISALALIALLISIASEPFANFFNRYISSVFRGVLATVSGIIPISLAELFIITLPVTMFFFIRYAMNKFGQSWRDVGIFCVCALSIFTTVFSTFVFSFGIGYHTSKLEDRLEFDSVEVNAQSLAATADVLIEKINAIANEVNFAQRGASVSPYSLSDTTGIILSSYNRISDEYSFIPRLNSRVKPIILSAPLTYTHIAGVYTYITGESNINMNCPDYTLPYTVAHELAHQRGIAREDEANFIAFLVCSGADDQYIRYCGYLNLCEYVLGALYATDQKLWEKTYKQLDPRVIYEMIAYNEFYEPYMDHIAGDISGAINDAYLQANGTEGTVSYGLVVELAVAYFTKTEKIEYTAY